MISDCENEDNKITNEESGQESEVLPPESDTTHVQDEQTDVVIETESQPQIKDTIEEKSFAEKILNKLMQPTKNTFSLFGYVVTYWLWLFIGIVAFIILFIFYLQFFKENRIHIMILLVVAELMLLSIPLTEGMNGLRFGFHVIVILIFLMIINELIVLRRKKT